MLEDREVINETYEDMVSEQNLGQTSMKENPPKKKKPLMGKNEIIILVVSMLIFGPVVISVIYDEVKAFYEQDEQDLEEFLEDVFYDDFTVDFDWPLYFSQYLGEDDMPYDVEVKLQDGETLWFLALWSKDYDLEYGVETTYEYELVKHYAAKYGMDVGTSGGYCEIMVSTSDMEGDNPELYQFLTDLEETNYYYAGQTFLLYLNPLESTGTSHYMQLDWENPLDYEEVLRDLRMFEN